jgi:hypothetical protein
MTTLSKVVMLVHWNIIQLILQSRNTKTHIWEAEVEESQVWGQAGLHSNTLSQKKQNKQGRQGDSHL